METTFKALTQAIVNSSKTVEFIKEEKENKMARIDEIIGEIIVAAREITSLVRNEMIAFIEGNATPGFFRADCTGESGDDFIFAKGESHGGLIDYLVNIRVDGKIMIVIDIEEPDQWHKFTGEEREFWSGSLAAHYFKGKLKSNTELSEENFILFIKTPIVDTIIGENK